MMNRYFQILSEIKSACRKSFCFLKLKNLFTTHYSKFTKKVLAFTLAETLIVMGIIGVVAALTLPNLNSSTGDKEKVAKLKKVYSDLNDALGRATAVYGPVLEWFAIDNYNIMAPNLKPRFKNRVTEFMKVSGNITSGGYDWIILSDGSAVVFDIMNGSCTGGTNNNSCGNLFVDIDGPNKGKNEAGKDKFKFYITESGIVPMEAEGDINNCLKYKSDDCSGWIIQNGNMDYLKADSNGKCPNNVQLSSSNTSCK